MVGMKFEMTALDIRTQDGIHRNLRLEQVSDRTVEAQVTVAESPGSKFYLRHADALALSDALRALAHTLDPSR